MLFWIVVLIALAAASVVATVFVRHWKEIRLLDPDTIKAEQERKVRDRLVRQRLDHRLRHVTAPVERFGRDLLMRARRAYRRAEEQLVRASGAQESSANTDVSPAVQSLLVSAAMATEEARWADAERVYLEILKQDRFQFQAYRGLGALYMRQGSFAQATETFLFLERIRGCDDTCYASLATIAQQEGRVADAEAWRKRAVDSAPKNAERHRELAALYLTNGAADYAWASARRAAELDPENPAVLELSVRAAILVRDREEAERRYEQLRTRSHDRPILQSLREQIDGMS